MSWATPQNEEIILSVSAQYHYCAMRTMSHLAVRDSCGQQLQQLATIKITCSADSWKAAATAVTTMDGTLACRTSVETPAATSPTKLHLLISVHERAGKRITRKTYALRVNRATKFWYRFILYPKQGSMRHVQLPLVKSLC